MLACHQNNFKTFLLRLSIVQTQMQVTILCKYVAHNEKQLARYSSFLTPQHLFSYLSKAVSELEESGVEPQALITTATSLTEILSLAFCTKTCTKLDLAAWQYRFFPQL